MTRFLNSGKEDIFYNILILFPKAHTFHWGKHFIFKNIPALFGRAQSCY